MLLQGKVCPFSLKSLLVDMDSGGSEDGKMLCPCAFSDIFRVSQPQKKDIARVFRLLRMAGCLITASFLSLFLLEG